MTDKKLISVIIPVYGVEKYIERCARSLFGQSFSEAEFIFVNDCTPDRSISVLEDVIKDYPECKNRVRILTHEHNMGLPKSRQTGLAAANGEYIIHCDSDDWVEQDMLKSMYECAVKENADLVICDFSRTDGTKSTVEHCCHSTDLDTFKENCLLQYDHWSLCNKLFRKSCYDGITYPKGALGEDMMTCLQLLNNCKKIAYVNRTFYNYYFNPNSITKKRTVENYVRNFYLLKENTDFVIDFIEKYYNRDRIDVDLACKYLRMVNSFSLLYVKHLPEYKRLWKDNFDSMPFRFFTSSKISTYNKVVYVLSALNLFPRKKNRAV